MKRIGITGPTGAGKTTALQALVELDAHIIDADAVYHALLESSAPLRAALTVRFGPSILDGEGRVNRKALGGGIRRSGGPGRAERHHPPLHPGRDRPAGRRGGGAGAERRGHRRHRPH
ncbi:MAG: dephospho-CoA kinase [Flavonifractor plautii]